MLHRDGVEAEEERLREAVNALPDASRRAFYRDARRQVKDPDTYAALNWLFLTGAHHFYLGRWAHGLADLGLLLAGVALLFGPAFPLGIALLLALTALEAWALFRSQLIVQDWNNRIYRRLLERHGAPAAALFASNGAARKGTPLP